MKIIWLLLGLLCVDIVVAGCGYKGELYLPGQEEKSASRSRPSQPSPP